MTYDVRSVANLVLDIAGQKRIGVSNMAINKIVYFLHGWYLSKYGRPLVTAKIEAWQHGPVFRELYNEFKSFGNGYIESKAKKIDLRSGERVICSYNFPDDEMTFLCDIINCFISMPAYKLREISHVEGGAWDMVWNGKYKHSISMSSRSA